MATRKWKSEFLVNTSTAGNQTNTAVSALQDGSFVICWLDDDPAINVVRFQRFDALGNKVGAETVVPQAGSGYTDQLPPAITALSDGRFYISAPTLFGGTDNDLLGHVFNADGTVSYALNAASSGNEESQVAVAGLAAAATVSVWQDANQNGGDIRFFVVDGNNQAGTFGTVNTLTTGQQLFPQVASSRDGTTFTVTWVDSSSTFGDIKFQVFTYDSNTNTASTFGSELFANNIADDIQNAPDITYLDNNRFVIAWETEVATNTHGDGDTTAIKFAVYTTNGQQLVGERLVNTTVAGGQNAPQVTALNNGNFVIAWTDNSATGVDGSLASIRLQAFNGVGEKIGGEIIVNSTTSGNQEQVSLTALADGRVVVTWVDYSDSTGEVRAQIVDPRDGVIDGTGGADTLYGHDAIGDIMSGGAGGDTLYGLDGSDQLYGGEDGDFIDGGLGADFMAGGAGMDSYFVDNANDVIVEQAGVSTGDNVYSTVSYVLKAGVAVEGLAAGAGAGAINLTGNAFAQNLVGNSLNNTLDGGADALQDSLIGGFGNDTYVIRSGNDLIFESGGQGTADRARVTVNFTLAGDDNIEFLETLVPTGIGAINLTGNGVAQTITGNNGMNTIRGMGGIDSLRGNLGNDTFHYALQSEGNDKLLDFSSNAAGNNDRFTFTNAAFGNVGLGVLQAAEFQSGVSNVALAPGVRFFYETDTHILRFDSNGSGGGSAVVIATLQAGATFGIGDIFIV